MPLPLLNPTSIPNTSGWVDPSCLSTPYTPPSGPVPRAGGATGPAILARTVPYPPSSPPPHILLPAIHGILLSDLEHWSLVSVSPNVGGGFGGGDLCYSPSLGLWVATGSVNSGNVHSSIFTSPDGTEWTPRHSYFDADTSKNRFVSIAWSPALGIFVAVGSTQGVSPPPPGPFVNADGYIVTSSDGITWNLVYSLPAHVALSTVIWSPELSLFLAGGSENALIATQQVLLISSDGVSWTFIGPTYSSGRSMEVLSIGWDPHIGLFVAFVNAVFGASDFGMTTSPDGTTWTTYLEDLSFGTTIYDGIYPNQLDFHIDAQYHFDGGASLPNHGHFDFSAFSLSFANSPLSSGLAAVGAFAGGPTALGVAKIPHDISSSQACSNPGPFVIPSVSGPDPTPDPTSAF